MREASTGVDCERKRVSHLVVLRGTTFPAMFIVNGSIFRIITGCTHVCNLSIPRTSSHTQQSEDSVGSFVCTTGQMRLALQVTPKKKRNTFEALLMSRQPNQQNPSGSGFLLSAQRQAQGERYAQEKHNLEQGTSSVPAVETRERPRLGFKYSGGCAGEWTHAYDTLPDRHIHIPSLSLSSCASFYTGKHNAVGSAPGGGARGAKRTKTRSCCGLGHGWVNRKRKPGNPRPTNKNHPDKFQSHRVIPNREHQRRLFFEKKNRTTNKTNIRATP